MFGPAALALAGLLGWVLWPKHAPVRQPAPIVDGSKPDAPLPEKIVPLGETRIVTVSNPKVRIIPEGASYDTNDLLRTANGKGAHAFDTRLLQIVEPRRMTDEEGSTVYLGEVVNVSTTDAAIAPVLSITLRRLDGMTEQKKHTFTDVPPGAHLPLFFSFTNGPVQFSDMHFDWAPAKAYSLDDSAHAHLEVSVTGRENTTARVQEIGDRNGVFTYPWTHLTGRITNRGEAAARNTSLYVALYDANGRIIGYKIDKIESDLVPGATVPFDTGAAPLGSLPAAVHVTAAPTSPPAL